MINNIFINGNLVSRIEKIGRNNFAIINDLIKISFKDIKGIEIECCDCNKTYIRKSIQNVFLTKKYTCLSCKNSGKNNPFYGKRHSENSKKKMGGASVDYSGKNNPFYGKKHSEESREKIKINHANVSGPKNPFYGKTHTKENKQIISDNTKKYFASLSKEDKNKIYSKQKKSINKYRINNEEKFLNDKRKAAHHSHVSQFNNSSMNSIEKKVFDFLNVKYPNMFEYSVILDKYQFDFGCKNYRILIEANGDYWHCNPKVYSTPKNKTQKLGIKRDSKKKKFCKKHNFKLFIIWESDINNNNFTDLEKRLDKIIAH